MKCIQGWDRLQPHLLPECVEDYVGPDNPVRLLNAFVDSLDLRKAGFVFPKEQAQNLGRPGYHPAEMLKLYLYGYVHRLRSSRQLERECHHNLEVIWLLAKLAPDFKTIADFRKNNAQAFKAVAKEFTAICAELELFGRELIAIDGTKVKGQNSLQKNWSVSKLEKENKRIEERVQKYLKGLEQADAQAGPVPKGMSAEELQEKMKRLRGRQEEVQIKLEALLNSGQSQFSATDAQSRAMKGAHGPLVGYNVQAAVDAKHHMLAVVEVTNHVTDQASLAEVAQAAKEELQITQAEVLADGGYYRSEDIKACQEMGMEPYLPEVKNSPSERKGLYGKKDFKYDSVQDVYECPAGVVLKKRREMDVDGKRVFNYDNPQGCAGCALKSRCTQAGFRTLSRWEHAECLEKMASQVGAAPEKMAKRKTLIEHCWGTFKWLLPGGFLLKGLKKVQAEASLAHLAYNLKRAVAVVGMEKLMEVLQPKAA